MEVVPMRNISRTQEKSNAFDSDFRQSTRTARPPALDGDSAMPRTFPYRLVAGVVAALCLTTQSLTAQAAGRRREPLPLDVALSLRSHNGRSPIDISPDGQWVAHTVASRETVPRDTASLVFSATGVSFAEGDSRMEATLTNTRTGEDIRLGGAKSSSWAAVWSPDGNRVAFYSDEGGEAGLWIWEKATRTATRFPGIIVRPFFGFELVRWLPDGQRLLCKILPSGVSIAQANARGRTSRAATSRFPKVAPGAPSVFVQRSVPSAPGDSLRPPAASPPPAEDTKWANVDLALVDLRTSTATRLVPNEAVRQVAVSPDGNAVAYSVLKGAEPNSQQPLFDLAVLTLSSGTSRTIGSNVHMGYGIEWSWSPEGRSLAYIATGGQSTGEFVVLSVTDGTVKNLKREGIPSFGVGEGEYPPLWDATGQQLYGVGDGKLWRVDAASGQGTVLADIPDWHVRAIIGPFGRPTVWSNDGGRIVWVVARDKAGTRAGIYSVDLTSRRARPVVQEAKSYLAVFNLAANNRTGEIAFVSTDQQHTQDVWMLSTNDGRSRQVSHLNANLDGYELGRAKTISWQSMDGQPLHGALLLPPSYHEGRRVPLVVFVYGGSLGSTYINRFGFWGDLPALNMHVLATRGYGVLFPDAPVREGKTMTDVVKTVLPGVNAAIDQGYADPDRLAVMGQSYGSFNTLSIIAQTNRFKAAVITAAVLHPDLFTDYLRNIGYYEHGQGNMGGSIWDRRDRYFDNSPLFLFDRIETPLLIGQGEKDGDLQPSDAIFAALQRLKKPAEYRLYQGEGHVITQRANVLDFWQRRFDFLAEHLDLVLDDKGAVVYDDTHARSRKAARVTQDSLGGKLR
jgi:dipeptidyl aminopeptidase/acylaminoacyl peptidase